MVLYAVIHFLIMLQKINDMENVKTINCLIWIINNMQNIVLNLFLNSTLYSFMYLVTKIYLKVIFSRNEITCDFHTKMTFISSLQPHKIIFPLFQLFFIHSVQFKIHVMLPLEWYFRLYCSYFCPLVWT